MLTLLSPDGAEGYPGTVTARVTYSLPSPTQLKMEYSATTDAPTPLNLTNHTYWNLADGGASSVLAHEIELAADFYTPVDDTSIPTGEVRALSGAMDLRQRGCVGRSIADADQGMGYDHNYVLRALDATDGLRPVARVWEPASGRWMTVRTDQPGVQYRAGWKEMPQATHDGRRTQPGISRLPYWAARRGRGGGQTRYARSRHHA